MKTDKPYPGCQAVEMGLACIIQFHSDQHPHIAFTEDGRIQIWQSEWTSRLPVKPEPPKEHRYVDQCGVTRCDDCGEYWSNRPGPCNPNVEAKMNDPMSDRDEETDAMVEMDRAYDAKAKDKTHVPFTEPEHPCTCPECDPPKPAEVGLDLHMLRHEALVAATNFVRRVLDAQSSGFRNDDYSNLQQAVHALIAGEEEHAKILAAAGPNVEPSASKPENPESPAYQQKRCAELAKSLYYMAGAVEEKGAVPSPKLLMDAAYWLGRMANAVPSGDVEELLSALDALYQYASDEGCPRSESHKFHRPNRARLVIETWLTRPSMKPEHDCDQED